MNDMPSSTTMSQVIIIGSGIGGLATACLLAKKGYQVHVLEKNESLGGRASVFEAKGYRFDMGPSWYLMPDVFADFFSLLGENINDHLQLKRLSPSYRVFFGDSQKILDFYSDLKKDIPTLESLEPGIGPQLQKYLDISKNNYELAKEHFIYRNYDSLLDFFNWQTIVKGSHLSVFKNLDKYVKKFFTDPAVQKVIQYQQVFLGNSPYNTPALYSIMNHIDFNMGVFYPQGGIYQIIKVLVEIAIKHGVQFSVNSEVEKIEVENHQVTGVKVNGKTLPADIVISNADMAHTETQLLDKEYQTFNEAYWEKKTWAPSALIMYLGVKGQIPTLTHHNLIFSQDWQKNFAEIFDDPQWPHDPSLYVSAPSKTDTTVAPANCENLFVLVPIAAGLQYTDESLEKYCDKTLQTMAKVMNISDLQERIEYRKIFCVKDFKQRYNSYKGTALGLAHTLRQTAIFRPNNYSKKVKGLFFVGAGTNPGIGMPICLISAELVYKRIHNIKTAQHLNQL